MNELVRLPRALLRVEDQNLNVFSNYYQGCFLNLDVGYLQVKCLWSTLAKSTLTLEARHASLIPRTTHSGQRSDMRVREIVLVSSIIRGQAARKHLSTTVCLYPRIRCVMHYLHKFSGDYRARRPRLFKAGILTYQARIFALFAIHHLE